MPMNFLNAGAVDPQAQALNAANSDITVGLYVYEKIRVLTDGLDPSSHIVQLAELTRLNTIKSLAKLSGLRGWDDSRLTDETTRLEAELDKPLTADVYNRYLTHWAEKAQEKYADGDTGAATTVFSTAYVCLKGFAKARGWDDDRLEAEEVRLSEFVTGDPNIVIAVPDQMKQAKPIAEDDLVATVLPSIPSEIIEATELDQPEQNASSDNQESKRRISKLITGMGAMAVAAGVVGYKLSKKYEIAFPKSVVMIGTSVLAATTMAYAYGRSKLKTKAQK